MPKIEKFAIFEIFILLLEMWFLDKITIFEVSKFRLQRLKNFQNVGNFKFWPSSGAISKDLISNFLMKSDIDLNFSQKFSDLDLMGRKIEKFEIFRFLEKISIFEWSLKSKFFKFSRKNCFTQKSLLKFSLFCLKSDFSRNWLNDFWVKNVL